MYSSQTGKFKPKFIRTLYKISIHRHNVYLWGIPKINDSTPRSADDKITLFNAGIRTSEPSIPKRFSDDHFLARYSSNLNY